MNKELIKKYKTEFDWWLDGGKLFALIDNPEEDWFNVLTNTNMFTDGYKFPIKAIVIKDEYVEFRKALAEGKTVQHQNRINGNWENTNNIEPLGIMRIKPDEPEFEEGDYVVIDEKFIAIVKYKRKFNGDGFELGLVGHTSIDTRDNTKSTREVHSDRARLWTLEDASDDEWVLYKDVEWKHWKLVPVKDTDFDTIFESIVETVVPYIGQTPKELNLE